MMIYLHAVHDDVMICNCFPHYWPLWGLSHMWFERTQLIEAETSWPPFCRRHFQVHFLEWKYWFLINISLKFVPHGLSNNIPALVQIMAWRRVTARFVTRFNLWLRHDLWPHNASICDPARFVTKSASICDQRHTIILESKLCRGRLVFVFTLIMYTKWYNMIIYIYELWYNTYMNSGARSLMLFTLILFEYHAWHIHHVLYMGIIF